MQPFGCMSTGAGGYDHGRATDDGRSGPAARRDLVAICLTQTSDFLVNGGRDFNGGRDEFVEPAAAV